eukprot:COSAG01_NODE_17931_length_1113_cov_1.999014_2_plen_115_part_01
MEANLRMLADVSAAQAQRELEERQGFGDKAGVREYLATMHHRQHGLRRLDPRLDQQATGSREEPVKLSIAVCGLSICRLPFAVCQLSVVICVCKNKLSAILQKQILQNQFCKIAK